MRLLKVSLITILTIIPFFALSTKVEAKRILPRAKTKTTSSKPVAKNTSGISSLVKFRGDRRAVILTLSNLGVAQSVSYQLSYSSRGTMQGANGSVALTGDNVQRELLFGTCSHGVCRYDSGITNARLVITTLLKNGRKIVKSYLLKV